MERMISISEVSQLTWVTIIVGYPDRLARFGYNYIKDLSMKEDENSEDNHESSINKRN